jgi:hypothetical protein
MPSGTAKPFSALRLIRYHHRPTPPSWSRLSRLRIACGCAAWRPRRRVRRVSAPAARLPVRRLGLAAQARRGMLWRDRLIELVEQRPRGPCLCRQPINCRERALNAAHDFALFIEFAAGIIRVDHERVRRQQRSKSTQPQASRENRAFSVRRDLSRILVRLRNVGLHIKPISTG